MGIVTALRKQQKDQNRVSVYVDDSYSFSLTLDQLLSEKLKKGVELSDQQIVEYKKRSAEGKLRAKTLEWLLIRPHAEREVKEYLYRKGAEPAFSEVLLQEFRGKGYVDDGQYARWLHDSRRRKNRSTTAIIAELRSKGIPYDTIKDIVTESGSKETSDEEAIRELVNKLRKRPRYSDDTALLQYLARKGFSYELIKKVLQS